MLTFTVGKEHIFTVWSSTNLEFEDVYQFALQIVQRNFFHHVFKVAFSGYNLANKSKTVIEHCYFVASDHIIGTKMDKIFLKMEKTD